MLKRPMIWIILLILLTLALYVSLLPPGLALYLISPWRPSLLSRERQFPKNPGELGLAYRTLRIATKDGLILKAWFIPPDSTNTPTVLCLHGLYDTKRSLLLLAPSLHEAGFGILLPDLRAHGESGGKYLTYGYYEKNDVLATLDTLCAQPEVDSLRIGLFGLSLGGAVGIQAAALDPRIKALVVESPYADLREVCWDRLVSLGFPGGPARHLVSISLPIAERRAAFKAREVRPLASVQSLERPILFIHGERDFYIPVRHTRSLYEAAPGPKDIWIVPGAEHAQCLRVAGKEYGERLVRFYQNNL